MFIFRQKREGTSKGNADNAPERLGRWTRNPLGSARRGSSPRCRHSRAPANALGRSQGLQSTKRKIPFWPATRHHARHGDNREAGRSTSKRNLHKFLRLPSLGRRQSLSSPRRGRMVGRTSFLTWQLGQVTHSSDSAGHRGRAKTCERSQSATRHWHLLTTKRSHMVGRE